MSVTHRAKIVGGDVGLAHDRPKQARSEGLAGMSGHGDAAVAGRVLKLGVRAVLDHDHPTHLAQGTYEFPAGDPRQRWHGANRSQPV